MTVCCDSTIERAETLREKLGSTTIKICTSLEQLLESPPDALFIFTPDHLHYEHAMAAIKAGCSIYLEKPMALSIKHCDRLIRLSEKKKIKLFIGHNMRYLQVIQQMRQLLLDGAIGELKSIWVSVNRDHWPPLSQQQLNPVVDVEDLSMVNLLMANGVFLRNKGKSLKIPD